VILYDLFRAKRVFLCFSRKRWSKEFFDSKKGVKKGLL
jgi:hypothetical protein